MRFMNGDVPRIGGGSNTTTSPSAGSSLENLVVSTQTASPRSIVGCMASLGAQNVRVQGATPKVLRYHQEPMTKQNTTAAAKTTNTTIVERGTN